MHNKNVLIMFILVVIIIAVIGVSQWMPRTVTLSDQAPVLQTAVSTDTHSSSDNSKPIAFEKTTVLTASEASAPTDAAVIAETAETADGAEKSTPEPTQSADTVQESEPAPSAAEAESADAAQDAPKEPPVKAFLLVTAGNTYYQPLPLVGEADIPITQPDTGAENIIHVSPEGVYMKSSNCDGQDCVKQGEITLDNIDSRVLGNCIVCLPNQVILEVYTTEELLAMMTAASEAAAE